jgi:hypothetical protein
MQQTPALDEIVTVAEVEQRHPDEWVLLEITEDHRDPMKVKGRLIAHSANRDDIDEPYARLRAERPKAHTYEFFTGDVIPRDMDAIVVL